MCDIMNSKKLNIKKQEKNCVLCGNGKSCRKHKYYWANYQKQGYVCVSCIELNEGPAKTLQLLEKEFPLKQEELNFFKKKVEA